ncbi:hypothetical protein QE152_g13040 [Popillia japonica]|uniref:Uncharacterized protein n=1 Tax=Popillia japonica TaxID=7064 RepID=A0AAW1LB70_POPJA
MEVICRVTLPPPSSSCPEGAPRRFQANFAKNSKQFIQLGEIIEGSNQDHNLKGGGALCGPILRKVQCSLLIFGKTSKAPPSPPASARPVRKGFFQLRVSDQDYNMGGGGAVSSRIFRKFQRNLLIFRKMSPGKTSKAPPPPPASARPVRKGFFQLRASDQDYNMGGVVEPFPAVFFENFNGIY